MEKLKAAFHVHDYYLCEYRYKLEWAGAVFRAQVFTALGGQYGSEWFAAVEPARRHQILCRVYGAILAKYMILAETEKALAPDLILKEIVPGVLNHIEIEEEES
jgi:hypothetical protein